jgi:hypothetical protein
MSRNNAAFTFLLTMTKRTAHGVCLLLCYGTRSVPPTIHERKNTSRLPSTVRIKTAAYSQYFSAAAGTTVPFGCGL